VSRVLKVSRVLRASKVLKVSKVLKEFREFRVKTAIQAQSEKLRNTARTTVGYSGNIPTSLQANGETSICMIIRSYFPTQ
jgi:hypothetical protein